MPIVAKNSVEYMLKKQQLLDDYTAYAKMRTIYKKSADSIRDTGAPYFQNMVEPKTTLETYLDKSKTDENLLNLLMNNLGANVGQAKQFIQNLDDNMKETLLDKFAGFEKIFEENFVSPKLNSLKGAFEIFIKEGIYDKKIVTPSLKGITDWLGSLSQSYLKFVSETITTANNKSGRVAVDAPADVNSVFEQVGIFVRKYNSDVIGYSALYNLLERAGFPTATLPKPTTTAEQGDTPSPNISTPISRVVFETPAPDEPPNASAMALSDGLANYDEVGMAEVLTRLKKKELEGIARRYNTRLSGFTNQIALPPKIMSKIYNASKEVLIPELMKRKYDPIKGDFLVFQEHMTPFKKLGEPFIRAALSPRPPSAKKQLFSRDNDLDAALPAEEPKTTGETKAAEQTQGAGMCYRGKGIGMGVVFTR